MSRGRTAILVVLLAALLCTGFTHYLSRRVRNQITSSGAGTADSRSSLSGMNSFAMALLLGGLRGPLVMLLWTSSESQKSERDLADIDTKIEWIRLLQPEFDSVHLYQIWNKAYNLSAQMASLHNKYATILDAADYAHGINEQRPGNLSLVFSLAQVYGQKLSSSNEKAYYRRRVRAESLPHDDRQRHKRGDPLWRREQMDPILDAQGNVLPDRAKDLEYLVSLQPFPYGIPPDALGYNYFKKAQRLLREQNQHHPQMGDMIVDVQPTLSLKKWADEELLRARQLELRALGQAVPDSLADTTLAAASTGLDAELVQPRLVEEALFSYDQTAELAAAALEEVESHLAQFPERRLNYQSHLSDMRALTRLAAADRDYLAAIPAEGAEQQQLAKSAAEKYREAKNILAAVILTHYVQAEFQKYVLPREVNADELAGMHELTPEQLDKSLSNVRGFLGANPHFDFYGEERLEYDVMVRRAEARLQQLETLSANASAGGALR